MLLLFHQGLRAECFLLGEDVEIVQTNLRVLSLTTVSHFTLQIGVAGSIQIVWSFHVPTIDDWLV